MSGAFYTLQGGSMISHMLKKKSGLLINDIACRFLGELSVPGVLIAIPEVKSFMERSMTAVGTKSRHAEELAACLLDADYRGHFSHGLNRLDMYVHDVKSGMCRSDLEPTITNETAAVAHVNGQNLLGPVVGNFSMDLAIKKARDVGIGLVAANGSNHYGIAGHYSIKASDQGYLGMSFTNTSPLVYPTRGAKVTFGTNPLTLAAPGKDNDSFVLDMATSTVAVGKIELSRVKKEKMPRGWGADAHGKETDDPNEVLDGKGGLLPLGGSEITGGYKGFGLQFLVEVLCGLLANGEFGPNIRKWKDTDRIANLGQCFIAINPDKIAPGFRDRCQKMMDICRNTPPIEGETEVLVAGDPERRHMAKCDKQGGILYHPNQITLAEKLAEQLKIKPMPVKK